MSMKRCSRKHQANWSDKNLQTSKNERNDESRFFSCKKHTEKPEQVLHKRRTNTLDLSSENGDESTNRETDRVKEQCSIRFHDDEMVDNEEQRSEVQNPLYEYNVVKSETGEPVLSQKSIMAIHTEDGKILCSHCKYQTEKMTNFYKHRTKHTGIQRSYVCRTCNHKFASHSSLVRHLRVHTGEKPYECEVCQQTFAQKIHRDNHRKYRHEEKSIQCKFCEHTCAVQADMNAHVKTNHSTKCSKKCTQCEFKTSTNRNMKQHMKFHRSGPEIKLFCKKCCFVTNSMSKLKCHQVCHSKLKPHQCQICNFRTAYATMLRKHLRKAHNSNRLTNTTENLATESAEPLKAVTMSPCTPLMSVPHSASSACQSPPPRPSSPPRAMSPRRSYNPVDYSKDVKLFACQMCTMKFVKLINLYKHLHIQHVGSDITRSLTVGDELLCVICSYRTVRHANLLAHMRKHSTKEALKPNSQTTMCVLYNCTKCSYSGSTKDMVEKHIGEIHDNGDAEVGCTIVDITAQLRNPRHENAIVVKSNVNGGKSNVYRGTPREQASISSSTDCAANKTTAKHKDIIMKVKENPTHSDVKADNTYTKSDIVATSSKSLVSLLKSGSVTNAGTVNDTTSAVVQQMSPISPHKKGPLIVSAMSANRTAGLSKTVTCDQDNTATANVVAYQNEAAKTTLANSIRTAQSTDNHIAGGSNVTRNIGSNNNVAVSTVGHMKQPKNTVFVPANQLVSTNSLSNQKIVYMTTNVSQFATNSSLVVTNTTPIMSLAASTHTSTVCRPSIHLPKYSLDNKVEDNFREPLASSTSTFCTDSSRQLFSVASLASSTSTACTDSSTRQLFSVASLASSTSTACPDSSTRQLFSVASLASSTSTACLDSSTRQLFSVTSLAQLASNPVIAKLLPIVDKCSTGKM